MAPLSLFLSLLLLTSATAAKHSLSKPCYTDTFYFHDFLYNGNNPEYATAAIVTAPAWGNLTTLANYNHFGNLVVFNDPITLDNNLNSEPIGSAQGFYLYDNKETLTSFLGFSFVFNSTDYSGTLNFAGANPIMTKSRNISVIGGTGEKFAMARGIATLSTDAYEGDVYFRLRVEVNLYECWSY